MPFGLCAAEMATVEAWEEGGVFAWVSNTLGERWGFAVLLFAAPNIRDPLGFLSLLNWRFPRVCNRAEVPVHEAFMKYLLNSVQRFLAALCILLFPPALFAFDAGMPNPPASPTQVQVGMFVADVIDMDEVNETFQIELILVGTWLDPRLAFDPAEEGANKKIFQGVFQFNEVYSAWWPQFLIINEIGSGDMNAVKIEVYPDGKVRYLEQRNVTLETPMDLRQFPFDVQTLNAVFIPFGDNKGAVDLQVDQRVLGATEEYAEKEHRVNIAEWRLQNVDIKASTTDYRYFGDKEEVSQIELEITMKRKSANIIWKVIFPLIILVAMMWTVFWLDIDSLTDRLNISFIGILTIVAYQFLIDGSMPRISYFTFTDALLLYSFVIMAATIFQSLLVFDLAKRGKRAAAHRVDAVSRWAFPVVYSLTITWSYFYYIH